MKKDNSKSEKLGDEAPGLKDFIIVVIVFLSLVAFSWIAWFKFGWFH